MPNSPPRIVKGILALLVLCVGALNVRAGHTQAKLLLAAETAKPGDTVLAGLQLRMDANWHTYWRNSGASGAPTEIAWKLPAGVTAGEILWPIPEKLPDAEFTTYIYKDEVVLLTRLKLDSDLRPGALEIKANVKWLECEQLCLKGAAEVQAALQIGAETRASTNAELLASWEKKLPQSDAGLAPTAWWDGIATNSLRPLIIEWSSREAASQVDFFPYNYEKFEVQGETERLPADAGKIRLRKMVKKFSGDWPQKVAGVLYLKAGDEATGCGTEIPIKTGAQSAGAAGASSELSETQPLWKTLLYGLIGGLILNIMPCVLPVIALKIVGFVNQSKGDAGQVRKLGLIYALGVAVSFLALAAIIIGLKAAGHAAGWGLQFSNPEFVVLLTILVTLVALNLFGLFEVTLSGQVLDSTSALASKHGAAGAFFNGVLATVLATPCTAPFLADGIGFAFSQSAFIIVLAFLSVAAGLALPYVVLSWNPRWLKFLPKPGAWMERFKVAMGFPMLATTIWLLSLVPVFYGDRSFWLGIFLVIVALAAWVFGEFVQRGRARRGLGYFVTLLLLMGGYAWALESKMRWRSPQTASALADPASPPSQSPEGLAWQPWSPAAVAQAREQGRPVLVDFTAKWCTTCNIVVKPALESETVRKAVEAVHATPLLADYTLSPDNITQELLRLRHAGVPLVLVYPANSNLPPVVLPTVLTASMVKDALERAVK